MSTDQPMQDLRLHLFHRHGLDNALDRPGDGGHLDGNEIIEAHDDEHRGPGTIRNHDQNDWSYTEREPQYCPPDENNTCPTCDGWSMRIVPPDMRYCVTCKATFSWPQPFYEDDEPFTEVQGAFEAGPHGVTGPHDDLPDDAPRLREAAAEPRRYTTWVELKQRERLRKAVEEGFRIVGVLPGGQRAIVSYDPASRAMYVDLNAENEAEDANYILTVNGTKQILPGVQLDYDIHGHLIGVEILGVEP